MTPPLPDTALLDEIERRPMEPGKAPEVSRDEIKQLIAAARAGLRVPALEDEITAWKEQHRVTLSWANEQIHIWKTRLHENNLMAVALRREIAALNPKDPAHG